MKKLFLNQMNNQELTKVFNSNEKLREEVLDDYQETEMFYVGEQLDILKPSLKDWSVGYSQRNHLTYNYADKFIKTVEELENSIPVLFDKDDELKTALVKLEVYNLADEDSETFEDIEEEMIDAADNLMSKVEERFNGTLTYPSNETLIDYFIEFYADASLEDQDCYVDSEDFVLKEDVTKTYN